MATFFRYSYKEFKIIEGMENFLPKSIRFIHNLFIENFIKSGNVSKFKKQRLKIYFD